MFVSHMGLLRLCGVVSHIALFSVSGLRKRLNVATARQLRGPGKYDIVRINCNRFQRGQRTEVKTKEGRHGYRDTGVYGPAYIVLPSYDGRGPEQNNFAAKARVEKE